MMSQWVGFLLLLQLHHVTPHSWIACSDYTEKNGGRWDARRCRGFARDAEKFSPKDHFGLDRGFNHQPGQMGKACKTTYSDGSYTADYPKAVYFPGQQVILTHPMKNHGASSCTNQHIPDFGSRIYHGLEGRDRDQVYSYYADHVVADLGVSKFGNENTDPDSYPKPGYQNAPNFCENTDKAMATYSFDVPRSFPPGEYTFVWRWSFNGPFDMYTTCFDVVVAADKLARDRLLLERDPSVDLSVACGGTLSNGQPGSTVGCGAEDTLPTSPPRRTRRPLTPRPTLPRPTRRPIVRQPTTPKSSSTVTTSPASSEAPLVVNMYQLSGEVEIGKPYAQVTRRFLSVRFACPAQVSFWNARLIGVRTTRGATTDHDLVQEHPRDVASGKVYFTASFDDACDVIAHPPVARHRTDEK